MCIYIYIYIYKLAEHFWCVSILTPKSQDQDTEDQPLRLSRPRAQDLQSLKAILKKIWANLWDLMVI